MQGPSPPQLSNEATIARLLLYLGAGFAGFMALLFLGYFVFMLIAMGSGLMEGAPGFVFFPFVIFILFGVMAIVGVVLNLIAAARVATNARSAGILGVVAAMFPPANLLSVAGAVLAFLSPEGKRAVDVPPPSHGSPP